MAGEWMDEHIPGWPMDVVKVHGVRCGVEADGRKRVRLVDRLMFARPCLQTLDMELSRGEVRQVPVACGVVRGASQIGPDAFVAATVRGRVGLRWGGAKVICQVP